MPKKKACSKKLKFEDCIELIDREISKRKNKWTLTSIAWMDFDDISQILKIHIFKKWHLYDESKPLAPWLNRIISNQLKNLIRNNYSNYCKPCLKCAASEPDSACSIYGTQDGRCPLFKSWLQKKKPAYDVKMALPLENHKEQINETEVSSANIELGIQKLNFKLKEILGFNFLNQFMPFLEVIIIPLLVKRVEKFLNINLKDSSQQAYDFKFGSTIISKR